MAIKIECTKDELRATLVVEFGPLWDALSQSDSQEFMDRVDDLVRQANNTRGTFKVYSDYLDADITAGGVRDSGSPVVAGTCPWPSGLHNFNVRTGICTRCGVKSSTVAAACGCVLASENDNHASDCTHNLHLLNTVPAADEPAPIYTPTPGVKAQLDLVARACVAPVTLPMGEYLIVRVGVKADMRAQGIEMKVHDLDTWIAEYVHTARENR